jgi:16S rRNA (uracil1498-N3)-methyltransferase
MRRYWISRKDISHNQITFQNELFHHIFEVCRQEPGNRFEVITEDAKAFLVEVKEKSKKKAIAEILEERQIAPLKKPHLHLCLSIPKFSTLESIIEKSVELGVSSIQPLICEFSFIKNFSEKEWQHKLDRWKKIVISATQQSGRGDLLRIELPNKLYDFIAKIHRNPETLCLVLYEGDAKVDVKRYLSELKTLNQFSHIENIWIFIGSEGGFSDMEISHLMKQGLSPVTLGEQILRVETACLATISVLKYEFDLMRGF